MWDQSEIKVINVRSRWDASLPMQVFMHILLVRYVHFKCKRMMGLTSGTVSVAVSDKTAGGLALQIGFHVPSSLSKWCIRIWVSFPDDTETLLWRMQTYILCILYACMYVQRLRLVCWCSMAQSTNACINHILSMQVTYNGTHSCPCNKNHLWWYNVVLA